MIHWPALLFSLFSGVVVLAVCWRSIQHDFPLHFCLRRQGYRLVDEDAGRTRYQAGATTVEVWHKTGTWAIAGGARGHGVAALADATRDIITKDIA